jgi:mycoredoxin-dependent peroxiredoxin
LTQLRQDYQQFEDRRVAVFAIGPDSPDKMEQHWDEEQIPYPGIPDPDKEILSSLGQEFKLLKFGRMPAVIIVGPDGEIHHAHYGSNAGDIPSNDEVLSILDDLISK